MIKIRGKEVIRIEYDEGLFTIVTEIFNIKIAVTKSNDSVNNLFVLGGHHPYTTLNVNNIDLKINKCVPEEITKEDLEFIVTSKKLSISSRKIVLHDVFVGRIVDIALEIELVNDNKIILIKGEKKWKQEML